MIARVKKIKNKNNTNVNQINHYNNNNNINNNLNENFDDIIIPIELKTGKASMQINHRAQVMLYILMLVIRERTAAQLVPTKTEINDVNNADNTANNNNNSLQPFIINNKNNNNDFNGNSSSIISSSHMNDNENNIIANNNNNNANTTNNTSNTVDHTNTHPQSPTPTPTPIHLQPPTHGILLYLNGEQTKSETITPQWTEICSLIISRNELTKHIKHSNDLTTRPFPPLIYRNSECERCYKGSECMSYHAAIESGRV